MRLFTVEGHRHRTFEELSRFGFSAGITLKDSWNSPAEVYAHIRNNLLPSAREIVAPKQVHGAHIEIISTKEIPLKLNADGAITTRDDICLTVTTADCLPLIAADPKSGGFAAIHVGWRSFVAGILENFIQEACELGMELDQARIILGPSIGPCCFEVGPEVAALFDSDFIQWRDNKSFADLEKAVGNKLISLGVVKGNIGGFSECTSCNFADYYSYRRDKRSPVQMVTFIYRSAPK